MCLLAFQTAEPSAAKVAEKAGLVILESGVLGALLLISVAVNLLLVRKLLQVQDKRVADKEADNNRLTQLTLTTSETVSKVAAAINNLEQSDRSSAVLLQSLKGNLEVLLFGMQIRGRTPPTGVRSAGDREGSG